MFRRTRGLSRSMLVPAVLLLVLSMGLTACDSENLPDISLPDVSLPDVSVPEATAPEATAPDTTAPDTTAPESGGSETPEEEESFDVPAWALILLILVILGLIFAAGRSSKSTPAPAATPQAPAGPTHATRLRRGYADARSVLDQLDDRAVRVRAAAAAGDQAATHAASDTSRRIQAVLSDLYGLESEAASASERSAIRETADAINGLDRAVDEAAAAPAPSPQALDAPRQRLERALDELARQSNQP